MLTIAVLLWRIRDEEELMKREFGQECRNTPTEQPGSSSGSSEP
jgi:hypothetical protein